MLCLKIVEGSGVKIGDARVKLHGTRRGHARLAIDAPAHVEIVRDTAKHRKARAEPIEEARHLIAAAKSHRDAIAAAGDRLCEIVGAETLANRTLVFEMLLGIAPADRVANLIATAKQAEA